MTTRTTLLATSLLLAVATALCSIVLSSSIAVASEAKRAMAQEPTDTTTGSERTRTDRLKKQLLKASEGVQYPGSESDSTWQFVSYPNEKELPDATRFREISGCPVTEQGSTSRLDFDETFARLTKIEPWMDEGQVKSARGFKKIQRIMLRSYDDSEAVYRCDTGRYGQVYLYFADVDEEGIAGLLTVSTET